MPYTMSSAALRSPCGGASGGAAVIIVRVKGALQSRQVRFVRSHWRTKCVWKLWLHAGRTLQGRRPRRASRR
ncbi:hypothetical protein U9M48_005580 [Paspalum notatum var. saurae]|uniref:Uncharacterized protein n=1 Tax=Paspalum notatum var. saurae TaxID=547442 RepID=A0AAQ3PR76_PASNO